MVLCPGTRRASRSSLGSSDPRPWPARLRRSPGRCWVQANDPSSPPSHPCAWVQMPWGPTNVALPFLRPGDGQPRSHGPPEQRRSEVKSTFPPIAIEKCLQRPDWKPFIYFFSFLWRTFVWYTWQRARLIRRVSPPSPLSLNVSPLSLTSVNASLLVGISPRRQGLWSCRISCPLADAERDLWPLHPRSLPSRARAGSGLGDRGTCRCRRPCPPEKNARRIFVAARHHRPRARRREGPGEAQRLVRLSALCVWRVSCCPCLSERALDGVW